MKTSCVFAHATHACIPKLTFESIAALSRHAVPKNPANSPKAVTAATQTAGPPSRATASPAPPVHKLSNRVSKNVTPNTPRVAEGITCTNGSNASYDERLIPPYLQRQLAVSVSDCDLAVTHLCKSTHPPLRKKAKSRGRVILRSVCICSPLTCSALVSPSAPQQQSCAVVGSEETE